MLEDDGLPGMICRPCHYQLEKYYIFRKKCESSDIKLRMHLKLLTESTGVIDGNLDDEGDNDNGELKSIKDEALVGASITIAIVLFFYIIFLHIDKIVNYVYLCCCICVFVARRRRRRYGAG